MRSKRPLRMNRRAFLRAAGAGLAAAPLVMRALAADTPEVLPPYARRMPATPFDTPVRFVLNGHVLNDGTGHLVSERANGPKVHQLLANYQSGVQPRRPYGGGACLRLMQFLPDGRTVRVRSYSPWLDDWLTSADQEFELVL